MDNMMLWVTLICDALCIFAFSATPFFTRKTELFGVSLPSSEIGRHEMAGMRRGYLKASLAAGAALAAANIALFLFFSGEMAQVRIYMALLFAFIAAEFLIYLAFHRRMQAFKAAQPWRSHGAAGFGPDDGAYGPDAEPVLVVDTAPPARDVLRPAWLLVYAAVCAATLLYLLYAWPSLPERVPVNLDAAGAVAEWADKGSGTFFLMLWPQWLMAGVFVFVYVVIIMSKRQIDAANPHVSREQGRVFRYRMSACIVFGGAALTAITGFLPIAMAQGDGGTAFVAVPLVLVFAVTGAMLAVMYRTGQGGSRVKAGGEGPGGGQKRMENTDDDRYWKLGIFYFNPADPAVFVEKRFGIGWTCNLARPLTWALIGALVAVIVGSLALAFASA